MSSVRFRLAPPNCATNILKIFPSSHLGEGCRLLTGEGRFESCGGSQSRPSLARLCLLAVRNLPSQGGNTGSNPVRGSNHLPVAQMDERPATNREACRFDSCREGQSAGCSSAGRAPRLGRGGRRIVTCHPDQQITPFRSMAGRCALNADTVVRFHQGVPIPVQWRNGNAALCKSVMSRFDTDLHLQDLHLQDLHLQELHLHALVARMDRPPPSKRVHAGSNPAESAVA
jgi:hypothetical protein